MSSWHGALLSSGTALSLLIQNKLITFQRRSGEMKRALENKPLKDFKIKLYKTMSRSYFHMGQEFR
jgi:hypothetical protein